MKKILTSIILVALTVSCEKSETTDRNILSGEDSIATQGMQHELSELKQVMDNLITASNDSDRIQWDNMYHHHDSLFWVHHEHYHHERYHHDDHHHEWVPYDPNVNHHHHYHPAYTNHHNDSLVTNPNNHQHDNHDHHFPGHDILQHYNIDSLHEVHNQVHI